jgi:tetratricopeptide (TPR) repeat protein
MIYFKNLIFVAVCLIIPVLLLAQQERSELEQRADSLYEVYEEEQALELYNQILQDKPDDYQALWRTSFLYSRIGNRLEDKDDQKRYYNNGIDLAERALQVDSTDTQSNFVMAVAMGRKALISGARDRVSASRDIKKYADRAIQYDSTHAGSWHVLGRWNFKVANLSWLERTAANTLFGGIPGNASNQKAAEYIKKAIDLDDEYVLYYYDLAKVYEEMGKEQQAISACRSSLDITNLTPDDKRIKQDCRQLIKDLQ